MDALAGVRFHRLVEVPRVPVEPDVLVAGWSGAHAALVGCAQGLAVGAWVRTPDGPEVRLLVGGRPVFPLVGRSGRVLLPPGGRAVEVPAGRVTGWLDRLPYRLVCAGEPDLLAEGAPVVAFDRLVAHLDRPFAWIVLARPLAGAALGAELDRLSNQIVLLDRPEGSAHRVLRVERDRARHRELSGAGVFWELQVVVAAATRPDVDVVAAVLCAAAGGGDQPYRLRPGVGGGWFVAGTPLLAALTRPPVRELPGVRLVAGHTFDVTPELSGGGGLLLGAVLDETRSGCADLYLGRGGLNRHTLVCGTTGSGKSYTVRHLLLRAAEAGLPWLVVEPAKAEYARMAGRLGDRLVVIRPQEADAPPAGLNPLEPAAGFPLQTHVDLLRALFLAAFQAQEPFPQILATALTRCYQQLGWDLELSEPVHPGHCPRYPTLADLQAVAEVVVGEVGYGREITDNVRGFIAVRLASLRLGTVGRFFDGGHPIDFGRLLEHRVVLEIQDVGDDADKAFFMGAVIMRLVEHLRVADRGGGVGGGLRHLTVIEEAHRLLRRPARGAAGPAVHAVEMFAALLAEVRAYGEGLVVVEQIPGKLVADVVKNTAVKIVHRLVAGDDRELIGATMNLDVEQARQLVTLAPGEAAVLPDGADRPLLVRVPDAGAAGGGVVVGGGEVGAVIGRRSGTCGVDCVAVACTLRDMRAAQQLLDAEAGLRLWAELAVLAHLAGHPMPVPRDLPLSGVPARILDCAVSHAVDDAVAVRSSVLRPETSPGLLAGHVCDTLRGLAAGRGHRCATDDMAYLAQPFRWERLRHALATASPGGGPDPRVPGWEREYRRTIPGETREEQLAAVTGWLAADHRDPVRRAVVAFGDRRPSAIEAVIGDRGGADWPSRVRDALAGFVGCSWPVIHLVPASLRGRP